MRRQRGDRGEDTDRFRIERAADLYLNDCYERRTPARADEFSQYLRQARPYVSRVALEATGRSLTELLRARQLDHARQLLESLPDSVTIEQIATASAFGTAWTFHRTFKAAFSITPGAYRRKLRNEGEDARRLGTPHMNA